MCHVGDVYTHFPQTVFYGADRKCVIKIFGIFRVNGESRYLTEVFASGYFFRSNFCRNFIGGSLYRFRVYIGQAEFGKDSVHLCSIISCFTQNIDHLSDRILCLIRPFGHFYDCLVSGFSAFQLFFRDEDVVGKRTVLCD